MDQYYTKNSAIVQGEFENAISELTQEDKSLFSYEVGDLYINLRNGLN